MRIVFLSAASELGGAERCLLDLLAALPRAGGAELALVAPSDGPLVERARALGVETAVLPMPPALRRFGDSALSLAPGAVGSLRFAWSAAAATVAAARYAVRLRRLLASLRPDVVHSNGLKCHLLAAIARPAAPLVWHMRDALRTRRLVGRALRVLAPRARGSVAISRAVAADVSACLPGLPVDVVYDGIDLDEFSPGPGDGCALDEIGGLPAARGHVVRIGLVATYARWKGQDLFLRACARVAALDAAARFFVAGGPIYATRGSQFSREELDALAHRLGLAGRVGFVPFQQDPAWLFRSLDVVVHASTRPEPFGRTIAEAMACGRPVVAARDAGAAEQVTDSRDALLYPPGDEAALARALARLAGDPELRARVGAAARATALARFSALRTAREVLGLHARAAPRTTSARSAVGEGGAASGAAGRSHEPRRAAEVESNG